MTVVEIAGLSLAEKLALMEALWDSLDGQPDAVVPSWHKVEVTERLRRIDSGEERIAPWPEAKERIRAQAKFA